MNEKALVMLFLSYLYDYLHVFVLLTSNLLASVEESDRSK